MRTSAAKPSAAVARHRPTRALLVRPRAAESEAVLPAFVDLCTRYLCHGKIVGCLDGVAVPAVEQQVLLMRAMHQVAMQTDIEGLQSTFLRLLLDKDIEAVKELLQLVVEYNTRGDAIHDIVLGIQAIHSSGLSA